MLDYHIKGTLASKHQRTKEAQKNYQVMKNKKTKIQRHKPGANSLLLPWGHLYTAKGQKTHWELLLITVWIWENRGSRALKDWWPRNPPTTWVGNPNSCTFGEWTGNKMASRYTVSYRPISKIWVTQKIPISNSRCKWSYYIAGALKPLANHFWMERASSYFSHQFTSVNNSQIQCPKQNQR